MKNGNKCFATTYIFVAFVAPHKLGGTHFSVVDNNRCKSVPPLRKSADPAAFSFVLLFTVILKYFHKNFVLLNYCISISLYFNNYQTWTKSAIPADNGIS